MQNHAMTRYDTYSALMTDSDHWQRTLAIISCKIIREKHEFRSEWNVLLDILNSTSTKELVARQDWHVAFTGGTYASLPDLIKNAPEYRGRLFGLAPSALGVIQIANLAVYGHLFAVAFFNHMEDYYADSPQNLCLRRICNHCNTPLLEDATSIQFFLDRWRHGLEAPRTRADAFQRDQIDQYYGRPPNKDLVLYRDDFAGDTRKDRSRETLAIVAHDQRKMTMLQFCLEHMRDILSYNRVVSTGTTGSFLSAHYRILLSSFGDQFLPEEVERWGWRRDQGESPQDFLARKIEPLESGPRGGDVQISAKLIDGTCHRVLFFQDPESAHPHQFDIRLMEKAVQDPETGVLFATSAKTAAVIV
jgi:methylglyoxal synthase